MRAAERGADFFDTDCGLVSLLFVQNLPIKSIEHDSKTIDVQPSGCGGLMIFVTGDMMLDKIKNPVKYSHSLHIVPIEASTSNFWIHNDMFRVQV